MPSSPSRPTPVFCTVLSRGQLASARALAADLALVHRGATLYALVVEGDAGPPDPGVTYLDAAALDCGRELLDELRICLDGADLAAALAPALIAGLLGRDRGRTIIYLAPEIGVYGELFDLAERASEAGVVLVSRRLTPAPIDARTPGVIELGVRGAVDPGIVAVSSAGSKFCEWWSAALRRFSCLEGAALASSQPPLDLAVSQAGVALLRDPAHGVAYWNIEERSLHQRGAGFLVGEERLTTFHFAGLDPDRPELLSLEAGSRPRALLSEDGALAELVVRRLERLRAFGTAEPVPVVLGDGTPLDERMRRLFRRALLQSLEEATPPPVDPLGPSGPAPFYEFLASPDPSEPLAPTTPRLLVDIHAGRADLRWHFPRIGTVDAVAFRNWVEHHGLVEEEIAPPLVHALQHTPWWEAPSGVLVASPDELAEGVALIGYLSADAGLGEAARLTLDAFDELDVAVRRVVVDRTPSPRHQAVEGATRLVDRRINLISVNADHLGGFASVVGPGLFEGRYNIGAWVWETEQMPAAMARSAAFLDEIWVPSAYVRAAVEPVVDKAVYVFPYPVVAPAIEESFDPASLGIAPGRAIYLFSYDFLSSFTRKNPLGALEAFIRAFAPDEGPVLVLKSLNGHLRLAELERLRLAARGRADVVVLDQYLTSGERSALIAAASCFVSLHRAEGFGLGLAEAMALGTPVVATGYSGNLEFMDDKSALLVPARTVSVGPGVPPYAPEARWGEPDLEVAAAMLREVYEHPDEAAARAVVGRARIAAIGPERARAFLAERLAAITEALDGGYTSGAAAAVADSF